MDKNQGGYYSDLEFIGSSPSAPPWPLATIDEFQVKALVPYYNIKLTLTSTPTGYPANSYLRTAGVWNAKPSAYSANGATVSTSLASFATPRVSLAGGYYGVASSLSPLIQSTTALSSIRSNQVFDVNGTGNAISSSPANGYGPTSVLNGSYTNNTTTYINVTTSSSPTVYVAFVYQINSTGSYYVHWVNATMSLVVTYK